MSQAGPPRNLSLAVSGAGDQEPGAGGEKEHHLPLLKGRGRPARQKSLSPLCPHPSVPALPLSPSSPLKSPMTAGAGAGVGETPLRPCPDLLALSLLYEQRLHPITQVTKQTAKQTMTPELMHSQLEDKDDKSYGHKEIQRTVDRNCSLQVFALGEVW